LRLGHNAQLLRKVARVPSESAGQLLRFTAVRLRRRLLHQRKVKKPDQPRWASERPTGSMNHRAPRQAVFDFGPPISGTMAPAPASQRHLIEIIEFSQRLFRPASPHETILLRDETISRVARRHPETADGYQFDNENGGQRRHLKPETVKCEPSASSLPSLSCWAVPR
jgi:hypothetical protein